MPELVTKLDKQRSSYLDSVNAETVTLIRRNYVELLEDSWITNGKKRFEKLKADLHADPTNKQKAFQVDISRNHVEFQDRQLSRSRGLIEMHELRGTANSQLVLRDQNRNNKYLQLTAEENVYEIKFLYRIRCFYMHRAACVSRSPKFHSYLCR